VRGKSDATQHAKGEIVNEDLIEDMSGTVIRSGLWA
jgi:hypothetical protein